MRLAFVGQSTFFRACAHDEHTERLETAFIEFRQGRDPARLRAALDDFRPDAVVVFRPEIVPAGTLADLPAAILGFLTEPIVRDRGEGAHWDLEKRRRDMRGLDRANVDRLVAFDPLIVSTAQEFMEVWRALPIPVSDRLYRDVLPAPGRPRMLFVGRSTLHREQFLLQVKHRFDCLHVAFGAGLEELERLVDLHEITFNVHNEPYPSFENRVLLHLAAGHLVITEPLSPTHGLQAGRDYLEITTPEELTQAAERARADLDAFHAIRRSGRDQVEQHRASRVWPALVHDMLEDIASHGTHRAAVVV
jgi:hypothetical protein